MRDAFAEVVAAQPGTGAAVAAWHDDRWVVDLWGGFADAARTRAWDRDSIVMPYSVTKPFAAVCALVLVDRGRLELDAPVQRYWPQLRAEASVRQLLSHQVGLVALSDPVPASLLYDWDGLCARLASEQPLWPSGTAIGESALFYGHLVGELVRRVDGRTLGSFLREEVCGPGGAGLRHRPGHGGAGTGRGPDRPRRPRLAARAPGRPELLRRALFNPPGALDSAVVNSEAFRRAEIPAINGHGTARAVAGLYAELLQGRVLSPGLLAEAAAEQACGVDAVMGGSRRCWGLGFGVEDDGFGMGGTGGSVGWACTSAPYAYGFVTGSMGSHDRSDTRRERLPRGPRDGSALDLRPRARAQGTVLLVCRGARCPGTLRTGVAPTGR